MPAVKDISLSYTASHTSRRSEADAGVSCGCGTETARLQCLELGSVYVVRRSQLHAAWWRQLMQAALVQQMVSMFEDRRNPLVNTTKLSGLRGCLSKVEFGVELPLHSSGILVVRRRKIKDVDQLFVLRTPL